MPLKRTSPTTSSSNPKRGKTSRTGSNPDAGYGNRDDSDDDSEGRVGRKELTRELEQLDKVMTADRLRPRVVKEATGTKGAGPSKGTVAGKKAALPGGAPADADYPTDAEEGPPPPKHDNRLKAADIVNGNIISTFSVAEYNEAAGQKAPVSAASAYGQKIVDMGHIKVYGKFRKFVIVGVFEQHFIGLPIYTKKSDKKHKSPHYADIIEQSKERVLQKNNQNPRFRGAKMNKWLVSKAFAQTKWSKMADDAIVDLSRPVSFQYNITGQKCAKLVKARDGEESWRLLEQWHKESLMDGRDRAAAISLRPGQE